MLFAFLWGGGVLAEIMEGERGVSHYEIQVSFSTPQAIHELGFVQYEENQMMSFMAPAQSSHHHHQTSQPLNNATIRNSSTTNSTTVAFGLNNQVYYKLDKTTFTDC